MINYKVAIIGSGPSAFYAAQALFKSDLLISVDMFEKLPTPFGLLRAGVAPDHQQMKTVAKAYEKIASNDAFRFFGNVTIGKDLMIEDLLSRYHSIIISIGAESDRKMNISGELLKGSYTATEFVAWYNAHPHFQDRSFDLSGKNAIVIGQGNVAVDVTRILAKSNEELKNTDITETALEYLNQSNIQNIYMIGRRGPAQAAFTELELKGLGSIDNVNLKIHGDLSLSDEDKIEMESSLKARKNVQLLNELKAKDDLSQSKKTIHIMFCSSPVEVLEDNNQQVTSVKFEKTKLIGDPGEQKAVGTGEFFTIDCDILFRSIGYKGVGLKNIPFDDKRGVIPNEKGHVVDDQNKPIQKVFVTGWIKRGPSGVIGTNRSDSIETIKECLNHIESVDIDVDVDVVELLNKNNVVFITYDDWKLIDELEIKNGQRLGKPREKFRSTKDILQVLGK